MPSVSILKKYSKLDNLNEVFRRVSKQLQTLLLYFSIVLLVKEIGRIGREVGQIITPKRGIFLRILTLGRVIQG